MKHRVFHVAKIKGEGKFDLRNAAIERMLKYGLTTLNVDEAVGGEIHQFTSNRMRKII